jgi:hypothetical protein
MSDLEPRSTSPVCQRFMFFLLTIGSGVWLYHRNPEAAQLWVEARLRR